MTSWFRDGLAVCMVRFEFTKVVCEQVRRNDGLRIGA
jgi:hypothetical protein